MSSSLSKKFLEVSLKRPQSLTKSQYNWYTVAIDDEIITVASRDGVGAAAYFHLMAAASMADMYLPAFARWFMSYPSSMYLLAHYSDIYNVSSQSGPMVELFAFVRYVQLRIIFFNK